MKRNYITNHITLSSAFKNNTKISELIGVTRQSYENLINGKVKLSLEMLIKISYLTGLNFNQIIKEERLINMFDSQLEKFINEIDLKNELEKEK